MSNAFTILQFPTLLAADESSRSEHLRCTSECCTPNFCGWTLGLRRGRQRAFRGIHAPSVLNPERSPPMQLAFMEGGSETVEMQANSPEVRFGLFYGFTLLTTPLIGTVPKCRLAFEPEENMR